RYYSRVVDEWAIYDGSAQPPVLLETGQKQTPPKLMESPSSYTTTPAKQLRLEPLNNPDFIGAEAALKRASEKAIARDRAAGLEPVVALSKESVRKE
ncbi:MAG: hypothetical protein KJT03_15070, partial [Verrucomicrobiae bacterium]|nr:hypothetical protein [Verrucomicrobiae bacterium]